MALLNDSFDSLTVFYENGTTVIYKGIRKQDGLAVMLKTYKNPEDGFRIKHEYDLLCGKEIPGAGRVLEVSYNDDKSYLVRADTGAIVLEDYIQEKDLGPADFLRLAQNAALSLDSIHAAGIIHCDIKPANILVNPETLAITYFDFGISISTHQRHSQQNKVFGGTLEFMAPEQTGRLNMVVDPRSDLYSLGITLYYLLCQKLPFRGESAVEIIHAHTVLPPAPISQFKAVDPTIEAIVLKLLEKAPKKRYQSAQSLAHDLNQCFSALEEHGKIEDFILGEKDVFASLEPGQRMFGKEKNLEDLASAYHKTNRNKSNLVLLHGPAGCGKSSLIDAFTGFVENNDGYVLKGRFDWRDSAESYSGIRDLFKSFELYAYNVNLPLPEYRKRLLDELGENAGVLLEMIPSFSGILGEAAELKPLNPAEASQRARLVFRKTLEILCDAPYPYVLIFDDVQCADESSLELLLTAIESADLGNCLMVLGYNEDPVFLQKLGKRLALLNKDVSISDVALKYLDTSQIAILLEDLFDADGIESRSLASVLYDATEGRVEKLRTLLQIMYRERQITYDAAADRWSINLEGIDHDVLKLLESRYKTAFDALPAEKQMLLFRLACLGENFDTESICLAFGSDRPALEQTLSRLAETGWITKDKAGSDFWSFSQKAMFELCYTSLAEQERIAIHKTIIEKLYAAYNADETAMFARSAIFTRQALAAEGEKFESGVLHDIARYQLTAALQYLKSNNMQQAVKEFENCLRLLGTNPFEANYTLAYETFLQYALCCYALHDGDKATDLLETVLQHARGENDLYNAYYKAINQYLARAEWDKAKIYLKRYLGTAGLLLDEDQDPREAGEKEYRRFLELSGDLGVRICMDYPGMTDQCTDHHGNMLVMYAEALSFSLDGNTRYYLYAAVNLALENKALFSQFIKAFPVAAARYASVGEYEKAKSLILTGIELAEKNGTEQAFLWCVYGNMVTHWVNPLNEVLEIHKKAKYHAMLEGNAFYEAYGDMMLLNYHSFVGENLEEFHAETMQVLHSLRRNGLDALRTNFVTFRQYARCLLGLTKSDDSFDDSQFQEKTLAEFEGTWHGTFNEPFYYVYRLRACYIHLYFEQAVSYAKKYTAFSQIHNLSAYLIHVQYVYYYSMALLELCRLNPDNKEEYLTLIRQNQKELKIFADQNPDNFYYKYKLVETGIKGLDYQGIELIDEFAEEHKVFMEKGLLWDSIFVERLVGNFWVSRGIPQYEIIHKNNRMVHYKDIGALACIRILGETDEGSLMRKREARERERLALAARNASNGYMTGVTQGLFAQTVAQSTMLTHFGAASRSSGSGLQQTGLNAALDFEALLSTLEKLISATQLSLLTGELAQQLLQNGNAEKVYLFLAEGSSVQLFSAEYAAGGGGGFTKNELPIAIDAVEDGRIPKKLVKQVIEHGEIAGANVARSENRQMGDKYFNSRMPESFLCLPIVQGESILGAVYLENALLPGAFPEGRIQFLSTLIKQASALVLNLRNAAKLADYTKDLEKRLAGYLAQQNSLIAGIAHEINSPVGVCLTVATKALEKTKEIIGAFNQKQLGMRALLKYLEETQEGLDIISNNIMRAGDLVQNFKKMSVEQSNEVFETVEVGPTLRSIVEYVRPGVKKKIDSVTVEVPEDLFIYSSFGVLAQVFTNLIMNSAIHGFENSSKENNHAKIVVTDLPETDEIEIRYSDNGRGMDPETREKIFQPFFTTKRNRGGSGLGGHIILTCITQQLRGSVICESEEGQGTSFVIRLPKSKPQVQEG